MDPLVKTIMGLNANITQHNAREIADILRSHGFTGHEEVNIRTLRHTVEKCAADAFRIAKRRKLRVRRRYPATSAVISNSGDKKKKSKKKKKKKRKKKKAKNVYNQSDKTTDTDAHTPTKALISRPTRVRKPATPVLVKAHLPPHVYRQIRNMSIAALKMLKFGRGYNSSYKS